MTKKKTQNPHIVRVNATAWQRIEEQLKRQTEANEALQRRIGYLESEANARLGAMETTNQESAAGTIDAMARARHKEGARRHATPGGPNFPDDIYPPGCGPLQLVWSHNMESGDLVIGIQGDSFHHFPSRMAAVDWLLGIARRIINDKTPTRE